VTLKYVDLAEMKMFDTCALHTAFRAYS